MTNKLPGGRNMCKNRYTMIVLVTLLCLILFSGVAFGQDFPEKPVKIIVGSAAGGSVDTAARLLQPYFEEELGVPVSVENMPGAGHLIAQTVLYRTDPDGYTLVASAQPELNINLLYYKPVFGPGDLIPIVIQIAEARVILVRKDSPWNSFEDFIDACREEPGKYSMGAMANTGQHLLAQYLKDQLDLDFQIILYDGGSPAATAMLGGHIDSVSSDPFSRLNIRDETKALAVSSRTKDKNWPEAQVLQEVLKPYGISVPTFGKYQCILVRKELKEQYPERYKLLQDALIAAGNNEELLARLEKMGWTPMYVNAPGEEYEQEIQDELEGIRQVDLSAK